MSDKTVSLLLVDPEPQDITQRLKQISPNFVFYHASSGKFALEFLVDHRVDCVILELDLKDMSGFQILHHLVPSPSVVWTRLAHQSLLLIATHLGAQAALVKEGTTSMMLHDAIMRAITAIPPVSIPLPASSLATDKTVLSV